MELFTYNNLPLTQAKIIHSIADGLAPRLVGASSSSNSSWVHSQTPTTDSIRCDANINKTIFCANNVHDVCVDFVKP